MGNTCKKTKQQVPDEYPFNTMEFNKDGKLHCCFFLFLTRMRPANIINNVMLFDICMGFLIAIGYAFLFKERFLSIFPFIGWLVFAILTWVLKCKWQKKNGIK